MKDRSLRDYSLDSLRHASPVGHLNPPPELRGGECPSKLTHHEVFAASARSFSPPSGVERAGVADARDPVRGGGSHGPADGVPCPLRACEGRSDRGTRYALPSRGVVQGSGCLLPSRGELLRRFGRSVCVRHDVCHGAFVAGGRDAGVDGIDGNLCDAIAYRTPFGNERATAATAGGLTLLSLCCARRALCLRARTMPRSALRRAMPTDPGEIP